MNQENIKSNSEQTSRQRSIRWANFGIIFSSLGVVILLAAFYIAFNQLGLLYKNVVTVSGSMQKEVQGFNERLQQLTDETNKQTQSIAQIQGTRSADWRVMEAQYLTKLANNQLQFMHNIPVAIKMLEAASSALDGISDPVVIEIQKVLGQDISRLQSIPIINTEEIFLKLIAVDETIDQLPLPVVQAIKPKESTNDFSQLPWWKRGLHQTWQSLQKIIVVQHTDNQKPLIMPEQREALYQNIHAKMETAKWGLLHQQPAVYENSLRQTMEWMRLYFVQTSSITQSALSNLDELQKLNISPPDVTAAASLKAFQAYNFAKS